MVFKWLFGPRSRGGGAIEDNAEFERAQARELLRDKQIPIRILTNTLRRQSNKARLAQMAAEKEMAKLIRESQMDRAALLAEHAVQQKKLSLRLLSLSLKMKTVETMVDSAIQSSQVSENIIKVLSLTESLHMDALDIDQVERALKNINQDQVTTESALAQDVLGVSVEARELMDLTSEASALAQFNESFINFPDLVMKRKITNTDAESQC